MERVENGGKKHETQKEREMVRTMTLKDYINIDIPSSEKELVTHKQKRFLDFLKAHPSKEWFHKLGFIGRLSPFTFLRRTTSHPVPNVSLTNSERRHFRVPFVRKINWPALIAYCKNWAKHPMNIAMLIWLFFVAVGIVILGLLMIGLLNGAIPDKSQRTRWTEITNQILNALFTIMCLYQHPRLFHHLLQLYKWSASDIVELRKVYCKTAARRPNERAHITFIVILFHITCMSQYALCALYWCFSTKMRPEWAENLCIGAGIAAPVIAFLYTVYSPLGKKYETETNEKISEPAAMVKLDSKRVVITSPEWVGGVFDCWDDLTVTYLSFFCTICVFGWNMERLGFGNMYVHIVTFILLLVAPLLVFIVAADKIGDETIKYIVAVTGMLLCFLGLLYGGFWRSQMRKKFKLPGNLFCCGNASMTDFMQWLFCWSCSLAQEVRTGNFYDVEEDSFCRKELREEESGRPALAPLQREASVSPARSMNDSSVKFIEMEKDGGMDVLPTSVGVHACDSNGGEDQAMRPPLQPLIQLEDAQQPRS
ncbi:hypothetical protein J5N97_017496 [Dioscorea zingiberensis]|uniref:PLAC8 family protein n=1 Tax=Dioscorea zingiberensis TaxID=325984 RepID=A0A9D5CLB3_9LILI|nr:hypothetical protein J5N97_017496 [Dioscorea zingiberensis]